MEGELCLLEGLGEKDTVLLSFDAECDELSEVLLPLLDGADFGDIRLCLDTVDGDVRVVSIPPTSCLFCDGLESPVTLASN